jgi:hypothetical protein
MSMANNHGMDFGAEALTHSLELLHESGIATAGAGPTLAAARAPAIMTRGGVRIAMLAYTSVFPAFGFMATPDGPGVAVIRVSTAYETPANVPYQPGTPATTITIPNEADRGAMEEDVQLERLDADLVVVQFHWGVVGMSRPLGLEAEPVCVIRARAGIQRFSGEPRDRVHPPRRVAVVMRRRVHGQGVMNRDVAYLEVERGR